MSERLTSMSRFNEDTSESAVVAQCAACNSEITVGTEVSRIDDSFTSRGGFVHEWCASSYAIERTYDASGVIGLDGNIE